jgi:phytoene synthase
VFGRYNVKTNTKIYRLLGKRQRAINDVYAFGYNISNIVDSNQSIDNKLKLLEIWQGELENIFEKKHPVSCFGQEMLSICQYFNLRKSDFEKVLHNAYIELTEPVKISDIQNYEKYCDDSTVPFCRQILKIMGCNNENDINNLSIYMARAIKTTMILSNISDDANKGKLYIPINCLKDAGILSLNPKDVLINNNLVKARAELAKVAERNFSETVELIKKQDKSIARRLKSFIYTYKYYYNLMAKRGWEVISPRPQINCWQQIGVVCKAYIEK